MRTCRGLQRERLALLLALSAMACAIPLEAAPVGPPFLVSSTLSLNGGRVTDLVVDGQGDAFAAGVIGATNFPVSQVVANGGQNLRFVLRINAPARTPAFVAAVGAPTSALQNAFYNDFGSDEVAGLALDSGGNAYLVAYDMAADYLSTTGTKYVFKVDPTGKVTKFSIALDAAIQRVGAIAIDASGAIYLTGSAKDGLQTTAGAPYPSDSVATGCTAPYVMKLDPSGQAVVYTTYLGYSGTQGQVCGGNLGTTTQTIDPKDLNPTGFALALDASGNAYVAGQAEPGLAATPGAVNFGTKAPGPWVGNSLVADQASHAFVSKINPSGTAVIYTARIGGSLRDRATSIVLDSAGAVVIAGKTSSQDFPVFGSGPIAYFPYVHTDCLLWTPEVGFLTKLSADGARIVFSNYLPLAGGQLDNCLGHGQPFAPAEVAFDALGNIAVTGSTDPNNRDVNSTSDAIIPAPNISQGSLGDELLQIISADGQRLLYSTALVGGELRDTAFDPWHSLWIAQAEAIQRVSPSSIPVELSVSPNPACASQPASLSAHVAASYDSGTVDFQVDGVSVGTATIASEMASLAATTTAGIHQIKATYHGSGPFDGYSSEVVYLPVNQAGACL